MLTPWTLLLLAASFDPGRPAATVAPPVAPPGAACVSGPRPRAWRPAPSALAIAPGMRIDLDPEAPGRASLESESMSQAAYDAAFEAMRAERQADGSLMLFVGELLQSYSVVRIDAEGRPVIDCAHSAPGAVQLSRQPVPAPVRKWEVR